MMASIVRQAQKMRGRWWRRLRKGARHRANRRKAGLRTELTGEDCYAWALRALEASLKADSAFAADRSVRRLLVPLDADEVTAVCAATAVLVGQRFMDSVTVDEIDRMKFWVAWSFSPKADRSEES